MKHSFLSAFILTFVFINPAKSDIDVTKYQLGMSPETLHDQLVSDKFVFKRFKEDEVHAIKKIFFKTPPGTELTEMYVSTTFLAKLCKGKMYNFSVKTTHLADQTALLLGRKKVFVYLKDNNAVGGKIAYSKKDDEARVVETYTIDRNDGSGSVRGIEEVKVGLTEEKGVDFGENQRNRHPLMVQYIFENKWFCPK